MADKAEKVSLAVCRMLVTSNLDFDSLLDDFKKEGRDKIELRLRTAFLNKMSCQSKAVIDQTVRTSRLTVDYFIQNGERDAEELGSNSVTLRSEFHQNNCNNKASKYFLLASNCCREKSRHS